ncbi:amino acid transporter ANTL2-like [Mizuhopecten yessoensis]|uniref:amino acid transporter ANTL2-like n=1 Tax=Mizuhopecten yessoensis TaxID=6573 RepID=UPI000B45948D|nr:amino acid transporter ANTL2-like [Mizuhopecten yessoensis]
METLVGALGHNISFCFWQLIIAGCLIPLTWFGTPKHFWFIAYGATVATASAAVLIVVYSIMDAPNQPIVHHQEPNAKKIALALGTIVCAYSGHPVFLTVQMDMKRIKDFKKAFSYALVITTLIYLPVVFAGYFVYGKTLDANVLNNLPSGGVSYTALLLVTFHLVLAFIIVLNPMLQEVELALHLSKEFTWKRCVVRFFVVVSILFVAETLPTFNDILSLMGGSSMIIIAFVCPPLFHMKMVKMKADADEQTAENQNAEAMQAPWDKQTKIIPMWKKVLNYAIMCIAVLAGLVISVSAIINIVSPESFSLPCYVNISWSAI